MPTTQDVNQMTAEERLSEVADILATGLLRLRYRTRVAGGSFLGDSTIPLEAGREDSPHVAHLVGKETI
jgi:hypothetical protein